MLRAIEHSIRRGLYAVLNGPRSLLRLLLAPFRWVGGLFTQIGAWWSRRESRYLLRGMPALLAFGGATFLLVACRTRSDAALAEKYQAAAAARGERVPKEAALLLERVMQLRARDDETLFELARMTQKSGDDARTAVLLQELAPEPGPDSPPGYWPAHMEMGKTYLKYQQVSHANFIRAKQHFEQVLKVKPDNPEAHAYLGQLYFSQRMWDQAIEKFGQALHYGRNKDGEIRADLQVVQLLLAKACSQSQRFDEAEKHGRAARSYYEARVSRERQADIASRIILADCLMFLEDFEAAARTLNEGLLFATAADERKTLDTAVAQFNVAYSDFLAQQADPDGDLRHKRFLLLATALQSDPHQVAIFDRMMRILSEETPTAQEARAFLLKNVTTPGDGLGLSHLLLGSAAFQAGDAATAEYHLTRAYDALPNAAIVTNNLAWFLAFKDPPELDRALQLINSVLQRAPNDPRYLDTRGQIYTKLERWDDAIADLERALQRGEVGPETHEALAVCYGAKGIRDLEQQHEAVARPAPEKKR